MIEKIKLYIPYFLLIIILTFAGFDSCNRFTDKKLKQEYKDLVDKNKELAKLITDQKVENIKLAQIVETQNTVIKVAQKNSDTAIARLEKLEKPKIIPPTTDVASVREFLTNTYNDNNDTTYDKSRFSIKDTTIFPLVTDAKEWKINGPILTNNLQQTTNALNLLKITDASKSLQLDNYSNEVKGLNQEIGLHKGFENGLKGQVMILEKQLQVERKGAIILSIKVGVGCALTAWAYEHFRKK